MLFRDGESVMRSAPCCNPHGQANAPLVLVKRPRRRSSRLRSQRRDAHASRAASERQSTYVPTSRARPRDQYTTWKTENRRSLGTTRPRSAQQRGSDFGDALRALRSGMRRGPKPEGGQAIIARRRVDALDPALSRESLQALTQFVGLEFHALLLQHGLNPFA